MDHQKSDDENEGGPISTVDLCESGGSIENEDDYDTEEEKRKRLLLGAAESTASKKRSQVQKKAKIKN